MFLGLALFNLSEVKESEEAYRNAIKANKKEPLAWQGLANLFEKTWQVDQYLETATQLAMIFIEKYLLHDGMEYMNTKTNITTGMRETNV